MMGDHKLRKSRKMKELPTIATSIPDQQHQQHGSYTYAKTVDTTIKHIHTTHTPMH